MAPKDDLTLDLFDHPPAPRHQREHQHELDYRFEVCLLIGRMIKEWSAKTGRDRYDLAAAMSRISGKEFSKHMIDAWSSPGREDHNIPFYAVAIMEAALNGHDLTEWHCDAVGATPLFGVDRLRAIQAREMSVKDKAARKIAALNKKIAQLEEGL